MMDGKDYVLVKGDALRLKDGTIVAVFGQTCDLVPAGSLPWLLQQDYIALASDVLGAVQTPAPVAVAELTAPAREGQEV